MERAIRVTIGLALVAAAAVFIGRMLVSVAGEASLVRAFDDSEPRGGCPSTENCVSSYADPTTTAAIAPIECAGDALEAEAAFADAIRKLPDVEPTGPTSWIVYSRTFRFPDDVRIEVSTRGIEVLSSSRLGAGDLGVNRKRVEELRSMIALDPRCS